jgi:hypothetical protein
MLSSISSAKDGATEPLTDNITGASKVCCQVQASNATLLSPLALDKIVLKGDWVKSGAVDLTSNREAQKARTRAGNLGVI